MILSGGPPTPCCAPLSMVYILPVTPLHPVHSVFTVETCLPFSTRLQALWMEEPHGILVCILANVKLTILVHDPSRLFNGLICAIKYSFLIISKETFIKSIDIKYFGKCAE